jgi:hypothetical protein
MHKEVKYYLLILTIYFSFISVSSLKAGLEPGIPLPVFNLNSLDGQEIALQDYLGKIVIIHLWKCQ